MGCRRLTKNCGKCDTFDLKYQKGTDFRKRFSFLWVLYYKDLLGHFLPIDTFWLKMSNPMNKKQGICLGELISEWALSGAREVNQHKEWSFSKNGFLSKCLPVMPSLNVSLFFSWVSAFSIFGLFFISTSNTANDI